MADLTIAIASRALFDLSEGDAIFERDGAEAYRAYQRAREDQVPAPGVAFPFIRRLLALNQQAPGAVEVVLISRNDPDTGVRVRNALEHHQLPITRSAFTGGRRPWAYLAAFNTQLFLSANAADVEEAIACGHAAGVVLPGATYDDPADDELRLAFDFDGVLADDGSERIYKERGLAAYHAAERDAASTALAPGPLQPFLERLARIQTTAARIRTAIVTARSGPADRRVTTSLRAWGVRVDEAYFVGDLPKDRILGEFRPHLFFDDRKANAALGATTGPSVHVPFGILNRGTRPSP